MRLRESVTHQPPEHGVIARSVAFLAMHGFTAFDALMLPFLWLFAAIMLATPAAQVGRSQVYGRLAEVAPIECWALALALVSALICAAIIASRWIVARLGYVIVATWWFAIGGLVYLAATTLLSPAVYVLIGIVCLYRQAEIAVGYQRGGE